MYGTSLDDFMAILALMLNQLKQERRRLTSQSKASGNALSPIHTSQFRLA